MIGEQEITKYLSLVGRPGLKTLAIINDLRPFVEAMQSLPGKELLSEDINRHSELINKIYANLIAKGEAEQAEVIELQIINRRLQKIYDKLERYTTAVKGIKEANKE
jgi:hypothetical protein